MRGRNSWLASGQAQLRTVLCRYLSNPRESVLAMPPELQRLLGFGKAGNSLGFVWSDDPLSDPLAALAKL